MSARYITIGLLALVVLLPPALLWSGAYNVAADQEHHPLVYRLLAVARERSIALRAAKLRLDPVDNPEQRRLAAGNYEAMCRACHLAPGQAGSELAQGLYPRPPRLDAPRQSSLARDFWVIKHGIKATGMPAWGRSMPDEYILGLAAFLQELPGLSAEQYQQRVAASDGHSHGGSEEGAERVDREEHHQHPGHRH